MKECVNKTKKAVLASVISFSIVGIGFSFIPSNPAYAIPVVEVGPVQTWTWISQAQNILTASNTLNSYKQMVTDSLNNFTQLASLPQSLIDSGLSLGDLNSYRNQVSQLLGTVGQLQQFNTQMQQQFSLSGALDMADYIKSQQDALQRGDQLATQNYQRARQISDDVQTQYDQINKNQGAVNAITGTQSGFQAMASQMQLLTKQNAQMLEMLSAKQTDDAIASKAKNISMDHDNELLKESNDINEKTRQENLDHLNSIWPEMGAKFK